MFLGQGLQHFLVADSSADLLPAPPVESRFVAVDSGHSCLLPFGLVNLKIGRILGPKFRVRPCSPPYPWMGNYEVALEAAIPHIVLKSQCLGTGRKWLVGILRFTLFAFQGIVSITKAQRAGQGVFEVKTSSIPCIRGFC